MATLIGYAYAGFPLLLLVRSLVVRRPVRADPNHTPTITVVIAAYNEAASIGAKIENLLSADYPPERREILVASDGSEDGTNEIVEGFAGHGVRLLALERVGKITALNLAVEQATGEIWVFTDANSMFAPQSLRALVAPFADPEVGGVAGNQVYLAPGSKEIDAVTAGERGYWDYDRLLKERESQAGNTVSATGAIYAVRRELRRPLPPAVTDDFMTSVRVVEQGYRLVFAPEAVAYEPPAASNEAEFQRKVRVMTRGLRGVVEARALLNPLRYGFYAVQLFSHKVLRRLVAVPLLILALVSPFLWRRGLFYKLAALGQAFCYGCAAAGLFLRGTRHGKTKLLTVPLFFCTANAAALLATINLIRGRKIDMWSPQRETTR
jgi:cellulose synthase/poly-beta-1,6-N-acetylglucosamine synthase-like glycosyltransferase